jgi:hypothetical protein
LAARLEVDPLDRHDYLQEALVLLWELDPTRVDSRRGEMEYVMRMLKTRVRRGYRGGMADDAMSRAPGEG